MSEYTATIKLKADRSGLTGEVKIAAADIAKLNTELQQSGTAGAKGADGIRKHSNEAKGAATSTRKLNTETKSLRQQFVSLKSILAGYGVLKIGGFLKQELAAFQDVRTMIQGLSGSTSAYAETQEYLIGVAEDYSRNLNTLSESYARLMALEGANLVTMSESRQLLEGLSNASAALKVNNEQLGLVYYGLSQAISQPIVHAAELMQVMEPMPGLLNHMDAAAGLVGGGFRNMVLDGKVTSAFFKNTLIEALEEFEGAAARTYDNITSISNRIATQHTLMVAAFEAPIDASMVNAMRLYEASLKTLTPMIPTLIELTGDLLIIMSAFGAVRLAAWLYGLVAPTLASAAALTTLELKARATTIALNGLKASLAFLGGPVGVAVIAASAIYAFSQSSVDAAQQSYDLRQEIDLLAESYQTLSIAQIDQKLAEQQAAQGSLVEQRDALVRPQPTSQGRGLLSSPGMSELRDALEQYRAEQASLNQQIEAGAANLDALIAAREQAVERYAQAEVDAATALSKIQQELLDKYLPLEALTAEYTSNLAALSAIEASSTEEASRKERAIDALNEAYREEVRELTGVTKAEEDAAKAREKTLQEMNKLIDQYAPMQNAVVEYETQLLLLSQARDQDLLSLENYHIAVAALAQEQYEALNPGALLVDQMEEELRVMRLSAVEQEYANRIRGLSAEQIALQGDAIRALIIEMQEEQVAIDATAQRQQDYQRATENMLEDLQRSWTDYFDQILEKGKFNLETLGESIVAIMRRTMASVASMDMANSLRSVFTSSAPGAAPGDPASGGSVNYGQLAALVGGGVSSVLNASIVQNSAAVYEGGQLISEGAKSFNFGLKNLSANLFAGIAGSAIGTAVGEAVFGKQAQSNYGAMAGAVLGSVIPGVGTFLGSLAGGALDAMFGGDGYKRMSVGFDTNRDSVRGSYYTGTETFASGLQVNKINRRGDQEATDAITAKAAEIDAFITQLTRAAGGSIDMSRATLSGTSADYGYSQGSFFGMRAGEDADSEEALDALFGSFSKQLINHIEGLSDGVTQALRAATGSADEILAQFQEVLALDSLVQSGQLDILGDVTFEFAQQLAEAAGGIENLAATTGAFSQSIADQSDVLTNVTTRLRSAVTEQFDALNLSLDDFTSVAQFREYFDSVKQSLDAVNVLELVQAGNALALLIEQEKELADVRQVAMAEQLEAVSDLVDEYRFLRTQVASVAGDIQNDIFKLTGSGAVDLRSRLRTGPLDEQLESVDALRQEILANYNEQLKLEQQLHEEKMDHFQQQLDTAKRIDDYINQLMTGDLSPLSVADRLTLAQQQFDDVYQRAISGDLGAAQEATGYFDAFARLNQTALASSEGGVAAFNANLAKLQEISALLGQAQSPGEFAAGEFAATYVAELRELQAEMIRIEQLMGAQIVGELVNLKVLFANLPAEIALELQGLIGDGMLAILQQGANFGLLSQDIVNALGLMPKLSDLSDGGIAAAIEAVTALSEHPNMLGDNIQSLADAMGAMIQAMLAQGTAVQLIADQIAKNPVATNAANQYLSQNGLGSVSDYQSVVNESLSNAEIAATVAALNGSAATEAEAVGAIYNAAIANGVGSGQLAQASGYSQAEILALAAKYGYASFAVGTDRVDSDQFAAIHKEEIIFDRPRASKLRDAIVDRVTGAGSSEDVQRFVKAVEAQTALLAELVDQNRDVTSEQRQAFAGAAREISESVDRLTREMEERAA
ncbi:tape measure protein [Pseudohongiella acticola]|uniref:tape measure protein n=1 Tax=Pseudohongiella acticola TaxID=1524254 RepID=UPI0030EC1CD8